MHVLVQRGDAYPLAICSLPFIVPSQSCQILAEVHTPAGPQTLDSPLTCGCNPQDHENTWCFILSRYADLDVDSFWILRRTSQFRQLGRGTEKCQDKQSQSKAR